jgi:DNA-binding XRE family transcriptional regulator
MTDEEKRIYRKLLAGMIGSELAADTIIRSETMAGNLGAWGRGFAIMQEFREKCPIPPALPIPPTIAIPATAVIGGRKPGRPKGLPANGAEFRRLRGSRSQEKFAEICGVSPATIQRWESGTRLDRRTLKVIIARLRKKDEKDVSIAALTVGREDTAVIPQ